MGNDLFGAFGRDFVSADGRRLIIVAITARQWRDLVEALGVTEKVAAVEAELGVSFADEGQRFRHRDRLFAIVQGAVGSRPSPELSALFEGTGVCWGPYRKLSEAVAHEPGFVRDNPIFATRTHPGGAYPTPGSAATFTGLDRAAAPRAPRLGEHTDEVLAEVLKMSDGEIARLHDEGVVAGVNQAEGRCG
jgi:2-methylfumaryl-CoA isomerase